MNKNSMVDFINLRLLIVIYKNKNKLFITLTKIFKNSIFLKN